jgi:hypothetical protein
MFSDQRSSCTKAGGWVEFQDWDTRIYASDNSLPSDHILSHYHQLTGDAQEEKGYDMSPGKSLKQWMLDAGFVNVKQHKYALPLGTWPKDKYYVSLAHEISSFLVAR